MEAHNQKKEENHYWWLGFSVWAAVTWVVVGGLLIVATQVGLITAETAIIGGLIASATFQPVFLAVAVIAVPFIGYRFYQHRKYGEKVKKEKPTDKQEKAALKKADELETQAAQQKESKANTANTVKKRENEVKNQRRKSHEHIEPNESPSSSTRQSQPTKAAAFGSPTSASLNHSSEAITPLEKIRTQHSTTAGSIDLVISEGNFFEYAMPAAARSEMMQALISSFEAEGELSSILDATELLSIKTTTLNTLIREFKSKYMDEEKGFNLPKGSSDNEAIFDTLVYFRAQQALMQSYTENASMARQFVEAQQAVDAIKLSDYTCFQASVTSKSLFGSPRTHTKSEGQQKAIKELEAIKIKVAKMQFSPPALNTPP